MIKETIKVFFNGNTIDVSDAFMGSRLVHISIVPYRCFPNGSKHVCIENPKKFFHTCKVDPLLMSNAAHIILKWLGPFARQRNWNVVKEQIFIFNFCNFLFLVFLFIFLNSKLLILRPNLLFEGLSAAARILQIFKPRLKRNWSFFMKTFPIFKQRS